MGFSPVRNNEFLHASIQTYKRAFRKHKIEEAGRCVGTLCTDSGDNDLVMLREGRRKKSCLKSNLLKYLHILYPTPRLRLNPVSSAGRVVISSWMAEAAGRAQIGQIYHENGKRQES